MAIPSFTGLQTALRGLTAAQAAIDTTGHNIANANTPGYSRQQVVLTESPDDDAGAVDRSPATGSSSGTGVDVSTISRIRDQFLDIQYRAQNSNTSNDARPRARSSTRCRPRSTSRPDGLSTPAAAVLELVERPLELDHRHLGASGAPGGDRRRHDRGPDAQRARSAARDDPVPDRSAVPDADRVAERTGAERRQPDRRRSTSRSARCRPAGMNANDLLDQRDQLLDDSLSRDGQRLGHRPGATGWCRSTSATPRSPLVSGTHRRTGRQTLTSAAGGQLGALLGLSDPDQRPDRQSYRNQLDDDRPTS